MIQMLACNPIFASLSYQIRDDRCAADDLFKVGGTNPNQTWNGQIASAYSLENLSPFIPLFVIIFLFASTRFLQFQYVTLRQSASGLIR